MHIYYGKSHLFNRCVRLDTDEEEEILEVGKRTWEFFKTCMNETNNYLPTDNYQENRRQKYANRTSSTNIGFGILAIINAYDLKYITYNECINNLTNTINTIFKLEKVNGHLLNWYNIKTLEPLRPRFVSTVDSGNFLACMYVLKDFLYTNKEYNLYKIIEELIKNTDFTFLYNTSRNLFSIGYLQDEDKLIDSYYDMLMSENRITSLIAIASRQVTSKHWFALARNLINISGYKGLMSWSGTVFEYYTPYLFNKSYEHTLIDQTCKYVQQKYLKNKNIPWGISEAGYAIKDDELNYLYKAFGVPALGLKRGLKDYLVVSSYSSILMLEYSPKDVYKNILKLKKTGLYSTFGFYESIDYTKKHLINEDFEIIKSYMAHHQGMILTSINNYINHGIIKNRFHNNKDIEACDILLKERERIKAVIKKNKAAVIKREKIIDNYTMYICGEQLNNEYKPENIEVKPIFLKGKDMYLTLTNFGNTYLRYKDKVINRQEYKRDINSRKFCIFN
ncbi:MAG: glucoamylase family protein [Clostridia bacterium]